MTTQRQKSILKMLAQMSSVKHQGGDWDDHLASQVCALGELKDYEGITAQEFSTIEGAYSCPRAASSMIADLQEEVEGLVSPEQKRIESELQKEIDSLEKVIAALKKMKQYHGSLAAKYWTSDVFSDLDKISDLEHDQKIIKFKDDETGMDFESSIFKFKYEGEIR